MARIPSHILKADPSFSPEKMREYNIVFQLTTHSCTFSIFDPAENRYIGLGTSDVALHQLRGEIPWIGKPAGSVMMIVENNRSTLVPDDLFDEEEKKAYLGFVTVGREDETVLHEKLPLPGVVSVFAVNKELLGQMTGIYPGLVVRHVSGVLIESILLNYKNLLEGRKIFLNIRNDAIDLLIYSDRQLLFSNAFRVAAPEDVVYYLLFVMEQNGLNPEEIPVTLMGLADENSRVFDFLKRYIRHVGFAARNGSVVYSHVFDDLPGHFYYTLLNPV